jgi:predicted lipoprotein with Yx(FWY)xxD motif
VSITVRLHLSSSARRLLGGSAILGAAVVTLAACGSSGTSASGSGSSPSSAAGGSSASSASSAAGSSASAGAPGASSSATVSAKNVPGVGTVLVNSQGRTLYMLTTEKGGKITCTASSGCLHAWPETDLPSGTTKATAGSGVQSSLLGTVKGATGKMEVTYNGWPLYTFIGDSSAGTAKGQALTNFGGTWYVLNTAGNPVTAKVGAAAASSPSTGSGGGYGY